MTGRNDRETNLHRSKVWAGDLRKWQRRARRDRTDIPDPRPTLTFPHCASPSSTFLLDLPRLPPSHVAEEVNADAGSIHQASSCSSPLGDRRTRRPSTTNRMERTCVVHRPSPPSRYVAWRRSIQSHSRAKGRAARSIPSSFTPALQRAIDRN